MTRSMRGWYVLALAFGLMLLAPTSQAQDTIRQQIKIADVLDEAQKQEVRAYVDQRMQVLIDGQPGRLVTARRELLSQFRTPGAKQAFLDEMSKAVMSTMPQAVEHEDVLVRLNAMIIATQLTIPEALDLLRGALKDQSAAVRYWGAKAIRDLVETTTANNTLSREQQAQILTTIEPLIIPEEQVPVVKVYYQILATLQIPASRATLINMLNLKAPFHVARPNQSHLATEEGLRRAYLQVATDNGDVRDERKALVRASYRYMDLISQQLVNEDISPEFRAQHAEIINNAFRIVSWGWGDAGGASEKIPRSPSTDIKFKNWDNVRTTVLNFRRILAEPGNPLGLQDAELNPA